ncbi:MAG: hypothetical protein HC893_14535 [Chloroflexaceae bacterium]|nr:hypothetical protein [Chloroflexaceae bacterium]
MLKKALNLWFILPTTLLILLVIWLLLAPHPGIVISEEQQRIPTPIGATSNPTPVAPVATPDEQQRLMQRLRMVPEDAKVQMGQMQLASASETTQSARYTTRTDMVQGKQALFVKDTTTGQELRFGNAQGHAFFVALSDAYLMWSFQCSQCDETASVKTAVYASNLVTSEQVVVAEGVSRTEAKLTTNGLCMSFFMMLNMARCMPTTSFQEQQV